MEATRIPIPSELFAPAESSHFEGTYAVPVVKAGPDLYDFAEPLAWQVDVTNTGDALLVTGTVNQRNKDVLKNIYDQMPEPKAVIAIGACACTGGVFQDCYNVVGGVDHVIPVDVYVPGCAAKPEAIIDGVVLALEVVKGKLGLRDMPQTTIFE